MSRENVELVQAAFRAFESGDLEGILRLCDEQIDVIQRRREISQAYGQLGRRAAELVKAGELSDPEASSIAARIGRLEAELAAAEQSEGEASAES